MVHAHAVGLHEVGSNFSKAFAEYKIADALVFAPQVENLQKCLAVGIAGVERLVVGIEFRYFLADQFAVIGQSVCVKHVFEFDVAVFLEKIDRFGRELVGLVECVFHKQEVDRHKIKQRL